MRVETVRIVTVEDSLARAQLVDALAGAGAPVGVHACTTRGSDVTIRFDPNVTSDEMIDDLIAIETTFIASDGEFDDERAAELAAIGLGDPELDASRILERRLDEQP